MQRPPDRFDRRLLIGVAAVVLLLLGACDGGGEAPATPVATGGQTGAQDESADATAEEIATGFLEAFGAFDVDRATGYLAADAEISELLIETASVEGAEEELRLNLSMLEAQGYEQQLGSCEETSTSVSGTGVRCPFEFHLFGSDEIGRGPYSGSYFDVTVLDGEVVRGSVTYESRSSRPRCGSPSPSGCPPPTRMTPR